MIRYEQFRIKGPDIQPNYLLKPVALAQFFLEAFAYQCADLGLAAYDLQESHRSWVMTDFRIDFLTALPRWRELVDIKLWVREIKGLRLFVDFRAFYQEKEIAQGSSGWLIINELNRKPCRMDDIAQKFTVDEEEVFTSFRFTKMKPKDGIKKVNTSIVRASDLDFNQHMNSMRYLDLALESIPTKCIEGKRLESIQAKFLKEAYLGESIDIQLLMDDETNHHSISKDIDGRSQAICTMISVWQ